MGRYFHAYRIDHILGFFRIWEIPGNCTAGLLGHFRPSIPIQQEELESRGIWDIERWLPPTACSPIQPCLQGMLSMPCFQHAGNLPACWRSLLPQGWCQALVWLQILFLWPAAQASLGRPSVWGWQASAKSRRQVHGEGQAQVAFLGCTHTQIQGLEGPARRPSWV